VDEVERAPQLEQKPEETQGALLDKACVHQLRDRLVGERHRERGARLLRLALDERVELRHVTVVADVEEGGLEQAPLLGAEPPQPRLAVAQKRRQARLDYLHQRLAPVDEVTRQRLRRQPHDQGGALRAVRVAENDIRQRGEELVLGGAEAGCWHAFNVCRTISQCQAAPSERCRL